MITGLFFLIRKYILHRKEEKIKDTIRAVELVVKLMKLNDKIFKE